MNPEDIFQKDFLEKADVEELKRTPEGRHAIGLWIHREKCCFALAKLLEELKVDLPPKEEQERLAMLLFRMTSPALPVWQLMNDLEAAEKTVRSFAMTAPAGAFAPIDEAEGNA